MWFPVLTNLPDFYVFVEGILLASAAGIFLMLYVRAKKVIVERLELTEVDKRLFYLAFAQIIGLCIFFFVLQRPWIIYTVKGLRMAEEMLVYALIATTFMSDQIHEIANRLLYVGYLITTFCWYFGVFGTTRPTLDLHGYECYRFPWVFFSFVILLVNSLGCYFGVSCILKFNSLTPTTSPVDSIRAVASDAISSPQGAGRINAQFNFQLVPVQMDSQNDATSGADYNMMAGTHNTTPNTRNNDYTHAQDQVTEEERSINPATKIFIVCLLNGSAAIVQFLWDSVSYITVSARNPFGCLDLSEPESVVGVPFFALLKLISWFGPPAAIYYTIYLKHPSQNVSSDDRRSSFNQNHRSSINTPDQSGRQTIQLDT